MAYWIVAIDGVERIKRVVQVEAIQGINGITRIDAVDRVKRIVRIDGVDRIQRVVGTQFVEKMEAAWCARQELNLRPTGSKSLPGDAETQESRTDPDDPQDKNTPT